MEDARRERMFAANRKTAKLMGLGWLLLTYGVAAIVAVWIAERGGDLHPLAVALAAGLGASGVIYLFAYGLDNGSLLDPIWIVYPMGFVLALEGHLGSMGGDGARQTAVVAIVMAWGLRRLMGWGRGWRGMGHETWRDGIFRKLGGMRWIGALFVWALLPTLMIFFLCLPIFPAMTGNELFGGGDWLAILFCVLGIVYQAVAEGVLYRFRQSEAGIMGGGPLTVTRHPTYFGEVLFWLGIFIFGVAAKGGTLWTGFGFLLFLFYILVVALPQLNKHLESGRA